METIETVRRDQQVRVRAAYANSFKDYSVWVGSTGVPTQQLAYKNAALRPESNIGDQFLVNTRLRRSDRTSGLSIAPYFDEVGAALIELRHAPVSRSAAQRELPPGAPLDMKLGKALEIRRSTREYTGDPVALGCLASLLRSCAGITAELTFPDPAGQERRLTVRTVPSGGGLYPIDVMLIPLHVSGLPNGLYKYIPSLDCLEAQSFDAGYEVLRAAFNFPEDFITVSRAAFILVFVATPWRSMRKYGSRGMRYVLHECGSMAMALHLGAAALGIATTDCASFFDDDLNALLRLDGVGSTAVHAIFAGYGRT